MRFNRYLSTTVPSLSRRPRCFRRRLDEGSCHSEKKGERRRGIGHTYQLTFTLSNFLQAYYTFFHCCILSCYAMIMVLPRFKESP
ncbi:hypothetical protein WN48_01718 [Eufriesea mexicana]|uniref:Uncharacterized protein n=1 Tax=Eufriesea mexicana TaxID=516756 RepID=A0A310SDR9_9HYME|nr:hypothetical protein WN48_01718 [Eufriesea mexicana]